MTPHIKYFFTYEQINCGNMLMKNDVLCKVVGIGSICLKIFDGITRTLFNVEYVLN